MLVEVAVELGVQEVLPLQHKKEVKVGQVKQTITEMVLTNTMLAVAAVAHGTEAIPNLEKVVEEAVATVLTISMLAHHLLANPILVVEVVAMGAKVTIAQDQLKHKAVQEL